MRWLIFAAMSAICCWTSVAADFPDFVVDHHPEWLDQTAPEREMVPTTEFFPLGVYWGSPGEEVWPFVLDDLREHHMNCWWLNGGGLSDDSLDRLLTMAQQAGVRIHCQDNGSPMYYPWHGPTPEQRRHHYEVNIKPVARRRVARFRSRWGLLGWGLCEEMPASAVEEMQDYVALVRREDPNHLPVLLYNKTGAAQRAVELYDPPVIISTDIYPLGRDPRCAPDTVPAAQRLYRGRCATYYKIARAGQGPLWVIPQGFGSIQNYTEEAPWFGWWGGYYMPNPAFCTWEAWAAIAEGATGIIYYIYQGGGWHMDALRREMWDESCQLTAIGMAFEQIEKATPYLLHAEKSDAAFPIEVSDTDIYRSVFIPNVGPNTVKVVIVVNDNIINRREFTIMQALGSDTRIYDLVADQDVTDLSREGKLALQGGMGAVFALGPADDIAAFKQACH